jgi:hypothetical protein
MCDLAKCRGRRDSISITSGDGTGVTCPSAAGWFCGGGFFAFERARPAQDALHPFVAFVAGVLVHQSRRTSQWNAANHGFVHAVGSVTVNS